MEWHQPCLEQVRVRGYCRHQNSTKVHLETWPPNVQQVVHLLRLLCWKTLLLISSADEKFDGTFPTNVVVTDSGSCTYIPPGIFKSMCQIDITWFPFDDKNCDMKFGSWTYDGFKVTFWWNTIFWIDESSLDIHSGYAKT